MQLSDHSEKGDESVPSGIKNPDIHTYDILVFPKPYCLTEWALNYLCREKYKGVLVVEKLLAKTEEEIHRIMERLTDIQLYVFHSRLYAPSFTVFPEFEKTIEKSGVYPILLSRSCPFQCSFCFHTSGRKYRTRGTESVVKEIERAKELYDIKHLFFLDELFGVRTEQLKPLLQMIKEKGISFNAQTRADTVTEEKLRLFKEHGCTNLSVGIESASDIVLESMGKRLKFKQIEDALLLITKHHIPTSGNIIIGDIAETEETAKKSMDWYAANREKYNLTINMVQCYPGTAIFDHALSRNLMEKETFLEKADLPKDFVLNLTRMPEAAFRNIRKQVNILNFMNEVSRECLVSRNEQN